MGRAGTGGRMNRTDKLPYYICQQTTIAGCISRINTAPTAFRNPNTSPLLPPPLIHTPDWYLNIWRNYTTFKVNYRGTAWKHQFFLTHSLRSQVFSLFFSYVWLHIMVLYSFISGLRVQFFSICLVSGRADGISEPIPAGSFPDRYSL